MLPEDICNDQNQGSSFTPVNTAFCSRKHLIRKTVQFPGFPWLGLLPRTSQSHSLKNILP